MRHRLIFGCENAGALERNINAHGFVRQLCGIAHRRYFDWSASDVDRVAFDGDLMGEAAVDGIEAQQVGVGFNRPQVVDRNNFDIGATRFDDCAQYISADAAKSVDSYLDGHGILNGLWVGINCPKLVDGLCNRRAEASTRSHCRNRTAAVPNRAAGAQAPRPTCKCTSVLQAVG